MLQRGPARHVREAFEARPGELVDVLRLAYGLRFADALRLADVFRTDTSGLCKQVVSGSQYLWPATAGVTGYRAHK